MPLLIDAYNLLHVTGVLPPDVAGPDLEGLIDLLAASRYRHTAATLYCDGDPPPGRPAPARHMRLQFSGPGRTADDLLIAAIRRSDAPRRLTVVTSDREILREARRRRCRTIRSDHFLRHLAADHVAAARNSPEHHHPAARGKLTPEQIRAWIRRFRLTQSDLAIPPAPPPPTDEPANPAAPPPAEPTNPPPPPHSAPDVPLPDDIIREARKLAGEE